MILQQYRKYLQQKYKKNTVWAYLSPLNKYANWLKGVDSNELLRYMALQLETYLGVLATEQPKTYKQSRERIRWFFSWVVENSLLPSDLPNQAKRYISSYIMEGTRSKTTTESLPEILKEYANWITGLATNTRKSYLSQMKLFARWVKSYTGEEFQPDVITPALVKIYRDEMSKDHKAGTVNTKLMALMSFCDFAIEKGYISVSPMKRVRDMMAREVSGDNKWLDDKKQRDLIHFVQREQDPLELALILIMLDGGLRASEVIALDLEHVVLYPVNESYIAVVDSKRNKSRRIPLKFTEKAVRGKVKYVAGRLHETLRKYLDYRNEQYGSDQTKAFFLYQGQRVGYKLIYYRVKKYGQQIGENNLTPHILRHCFCKNLIDQGVRDSEVAMLAGHTKANGDPNLQALARYTRPGARELQRAINQLPE